MPPIFCIFAHPDDEAFGPGGTITTLAKEREVYLICVTDGNTKTDLQQIKYDNLQKVRKEELLASTRILGVKDVFFLGFADGTICNNMYHEIAGHIEVLLDTYQPDTLLTFSQTGISGHLDHIAVSLITTFVFRKLEYVKKLMYYCETEESIAKMRDEYFIYMPKGCTKNDIDLTIDISEVWETKVKAMRQHISQQKDIDMTLKNKETESKEEHFLIIEK